jgi:hypothetical protein
MRIVQNSNVQMQLDTGGAYEELPAAVPHTESLQAENLVLRNLREEVEKYALSLEVERDRFSNKVS